MALWLSMIRLKLVFQSLKGRCHSKQFFCWFYPQNWFAHTGGASSYLNHQRPHAEYTVHIYCCGLPMMAQPGGLYCHTSSFWYYLCCSARWLLHCHAHLAINWISYWSVQCVWIHSVNHALFAAFTHFVLSALKAASGFCVVTLSVQYASVFQVCHRLEFVVCQPIIALNRYETFSVTCKLRMVLIDQCQLILLPTQTWRNLAMSAKHSSELWLLHNIVCRCLSYPLLLHRASF